MPRWFYTGLLYLLWPLLLLRLWLRGREAPAYRLRWRERFGCLPPTWPAQRPGLPPIWIHAVSVGETLAAQPLVNALRERHPHRPLLITTMTPTGSDRVRAIWGDAVWHVYAPYDYPHVIRRFLRYWQPVALIVMETELWPNWLAQAQRQHLPVLLANARLSERSARGYARLGRISRELMHNLTYIAAQDMATAERLQMLGASADRVVVTGSVKFDFTAPASVLAQAQQLCEQWRLAERPVWVAASTHAGEDGLILAAHARVRQQHPEALLILVPRHPERFEAVARQVTDALAGDLAAKHLARRSLGEPVTASVAVLLGDTMGELTLWFALARVARAGVAFVGGSLVPSGGHNALEPLAFGVPALTGPHFFNFEAINTTLLAEGALAVVSDVITLADAVSNLFLDASLVQARRAAGLAVLEANRGALARQLALCDELLADPPVSGASR